MRFDTVIIGGGIKVSILRHLRSGVSEKVSHTVKLASNDRLTGLRQIAGIAF